MTTRFIGQRRDNQRMQAGCSYTVQPWTSSSPPPRAIHIRLSEDVLRELQRQSAREQQTSPSAVNGKGKARLDDAQEFKMFYHSEKQPTLQLGSSTHNLMAVREEQPHEVYRVCKPGQLELVGQIKERLMVTQELDASVQSRVRDRTEQAVAEKAERTVVMLDSTQHKGTSDAPKQTSLQGHSTPDASPKKPHQPSLLVANHPVKPKPAPAPTVTSSDKLKSAPAPVPVKKDTDDMLIDSGSSYTGESSHFSFSSASNASSVTSMSSGESPPAKDFLHVDVSAKQSPPEVAIVSATPTIGNNQGMDANIDDASTATDGQDSSSSESDLPLAKAIMQNSASSPMSSTSSPPVDKDRLSIDSTSTSSSTTRKRKSGGYESRPYNMLPPPPASLPNKRPRHSDGEASDSSVAESKKKGPKANGRTAGGARVNRPVKKTIQADDDVIPSPASSRTSTPRPANDKVFHSASSKAASTSRKRKAQDAESEAESSTGSIKKKKVASSSSKNKPSRKKEIDFTSSDEETDVGKRSDSKDMRGRASVSKPLRTAVSSFKSKELRGTSRDSSRAGSGSNSRAETPLATSQMSRTSSVSSVGSPRSPIKGMQITSQVDYKAAHGRYLQLHAEYERLRSDVVKAQETLKKMIKGEPVSDIDRLNVPSKREGEKLTEKAEEARKDLASLREALFAWARAHPKMR